MMRDPFFDADFLKQMEHVQQQEEGLDQNGTPQEGFPFIEPSELEAIRAARPASTRIFELSEKTTLADKFLGAWLGRAAGCQLGKPVEGMKRADIETYLRAADAYPLLDYIPLLDPPPVKFVVYAPQATRGNFVEMTRDDDVDYTILGLHILEQYGADFTTENVADTWLALLPYHMVFTAERAVYRNLINGLEIPEAAVYANPYREWIGAQIRADGFAYSVAGMPELAAEFAWRDARLSHVKNGIYGEMWAAAMIAVAFTEAEASRDTAIRLIEAGLEQIPANCRLSSAIRSLMTASQDIADWRDAWDLINRDYGHYHWVHTINNALIVALALLYGEGDFTHSIGIAVMGGWDTDCNGATVGSVLGAIYGASKIPEHWTTPLNNRTRSAVIGYDGSQFTDLAQRSLQVHQSLQEK